MIKLNNKAQSRIERELNYKFKLLSTGENDSNKLYRDMAVVMDKSISTNRPEIVVSSTMAHVKTHLTNVVAEHFTSVPFHLQVNPRGSTECPSISKLLSDNPNSINSLIRSI